MGWGNNNNGNNNNGGNRNNNRNNGGGNKNGGGKPSGPQNNDQTIYLNPPYCYCGAVMDKFGESKSTGNKYWNCPSSTDDDNHGYLKADDNAVDPKGGSNKNSGNNNNRNNNNNNQQQQQQQGNNNQGNQSNLALEIENQFMGVSATLQSIVEQNGQIIAGLQELVEVISTSAEETKKRKAQEMMAIAKRAKTAPVAAQATKPKLAMPALEPLMDDAETNS